MKITRSLTQLITAILFLSVFNILSCKKETSIGGGLTPQEEEQASLTMTESDAEAEAVFNDIFDDIMGVNNDVGMEGTGIFGRANNTTGTSVIARTDSLTRCFTISVTHLTLGIFFPVRIVIDFGNGCTGRDGHTRYGKIITTYTNRLIIPGASATTVFENFKRDSISVQGTHRVTNTSTISARQFDLDIEGARLSKPNGNYTEWNSHKTITQIEGFITPEHPFDDIYTIQGNGNGKVKKGNFLFAWRAEITEPLYKEFTCRWVVQGRVRIVRESNTSNSQWIAVLDYGNGNCDNNATITINGIEHQITLH